jgi:hypothetical protein
VTVAVTSDEPRWPHGPGHAPGVVATRRPPPAHTGTPAARDAGNGASVVLAVTSALARYSADVAVRRGRRAVSLLSTTGPAALVLRALGGSVPVVVARPTSAVAAAVSALADRLVPVIARGVLARLDVPALVREYVSVDELAAMLDVDAVAARVDLEALIRRVDVDAIAAGLDLDAVLERVDLDGVIARVDLEALVAGLDLDRIVEGVDVAKVVDRIDLDAIVERVDLDRAVDRVDVDRVIARADITGLAWYVVREIDLPGILRASTGSVTTEMVRSVRDQGVGADRAVERVVDRLLHRHGGRRAGAPPPHPGAGP